LAQYPTIVEGSALALEPHRLTFYLQELAAQVHAYYNKHRVLPSWPVTGSLKKAEGDPGIPGFPEEPVSEGDSGQKAEGITPEVTAARLAIFRQVQTVIRNGLTLLGVSSPEKM